MYDTLRKRMAAQFERTGISEIAVAISLGKGRDYIRDFLDKPNRPHKKETIKLELLPGIAEALNCTVEDLVGQGSLLLPADDDGSENLIKLSGIVECGVWRSGDAGLPVEQFVNADRRYPVDSQSAWLVRGDAWIKSGIGDGSIVIATDQLTSREGDMVIVRRERDGASSTEIMTLSRLAQPADDQTVVGVVVQEFRLF